MNKSPRYLTAPLLASLAVLGVSGPVAALTISPIPLYTTSSAKPNVLLMLDNSNSMDEDASGAAVGSFASTSKSEIARSVARTLIDQYTGTINMGLMSYQQSGIASGHVHASPYDVSYNPANFCDNIAGGCPSDMARNDVRKKFRVANPSSPGDFLYYNVNLAFYDTGNAGTAFCYSPTAIPFADTTADNYACYRTKTGNSDLDPGTAGSGYANWFSNYTFFPTDSDLAQGISDFGKSMVWFHVGTTWFANTSPGKGYLHTPVAALDATQANTLKAKLKCNVPAPDGADCDHSSTSGGIVNAGLTPIEGSFLTAKDYFTGNLSDASQGGPQTRPANSCGKDFAVLLTDGLPSTNQNGVAVTNTATALTAAATAAEALKLAGVKTYVVGFALPYGTDPTTLNQIANKGGTSVAYNATDQATLSAAMASIFTNIMAQSGTASAAGTNTQSVTTNTRLYQALFSNDPAWMGKLVVRQLDLADSNHDGSLVAATPTLCTGAFLPTEPLYSLCPSIRAFPAANDRIIVTNRSNTGIPFRWPANPASPAATELATTQTASGNVDSVAILNYLRGDASNEVRNGGTLRDRPYGMLGDIINSAPVYVDKPHMGYPESIATDSYAAFKTAQNSRTPMLYVGANDGMLHAFKADTLEEKWAYIPGVLFPKLKALTQTTYTHLFYVDGTPAVSDAYIGGSWKTLLVGGLNYGGKGIYAVDITNPDAVTDETSAAAKILWEYTADSDADLGYTYSPPIIGKLNNGDWAAIFGNGYNSTNNVPALFIVNLSTGALIKKLETTTPTCGDRSLSGGMGPVNAVDVDGDHIVDYVYGGDLQGSIWKFDLTSNSTASWGMAYSNRFYTAKDPNGNVQPITTKPLVIKHPTQGSGYMVYFGTGKYLEQADTESAGQQTQTFYGVWDNGSAVTCGRSGLQQQSINYEFTSDGATWRQLSSNAVDWTTRQGWYLDLYNLNSSSGSAPATNNTGEKVIANAVYRSGRLIFNTLAPSSATCSAGGTSYAMIVDPATGGALPYSAFDVNGDGVFNASDFRTSAGGTGSGAKAVSGMSLGAGIAATAVVLNESRLNQLSVSTKSNGDIANYRIRYGSGVGRIYWGEAQRPPALTIDSGGGSDD
jgi:type IV pilus assembly protein PilY1